MAPCCDLRAATNHIADPRLSVKCHPVTRDVARILVIIAPSFIHYI